ncbi:STAS domain-containing protein [Desulfolutivibrio sulfoxidireducens]|uniref:STAS domain-containing protein n=1 Tax=Desulfolutivibrio sulfoxidireducens TaxID=2773299 RepID=UPI00159D6CCB|nr:STAS domain-containing protein [Desulfolutivibrio sulfoxidireducens]QLA16400.1 STAS domain-containing protein [Desulfolutivibrio sulfoxidireducens]QLA19719.1 STAS domain-containing protein [Desulfolutivibrio sulfoxidireducens]
MGTHDLIRDDVGVTLRLEGDWTVRGAAALREALLSALSADALVRVDLSDVTAVDMSMFEVLHAACQSAARDARRFERTGVLSETVRKAATLSGFTDYAPFRDFWKNEERNVQDDHDRG